VLVLIGCGLLFTALALGFGAWKEDLEARHAILDELEDEPDDHVRVVPQIDWPL
jgi:hypothetical protein